MAIYLSVFILLIVLALSELLLKNEKIIFISSSLLALMAGLRFHTGYDFQSYEKFYREVDQISEVINGSIDAEPGYLLLNYIFSSVGLNFYYFILIFSVFSIGLLAYFLSKYTKYPTIFLLYYYVRFFLVRDMGQIRSAIACIILLYAIPYILKKEPMKFFIIVFVASLFHISAWFFVIAYLFNNKFKKITLKSISLMVLACSFIGVIVQIPKLYIWAVPDRYISYFTNPVYTQGKWIMNPILWMQIGILIGSILCYHSNNKEEKTMFEGALKIYLVSSLILLAAGNLGTVGGRISTLFATTEILIVPYLFMNFTKNKLLNIIFYIGFTIIIFILIFVVSNAYKSYIPYQTIFTL